MLRGLCLAALLVQSVCALRQPRRNVLAGATSIMATSAAAAMPVAPCAAYTAPPGFEAPRVEGIGGGADIFAETAKDDVYYPPSLIGIWQCERTVASVEGDAAQAEGAWRLLGGTGSFREPESFLLRYIAQPGASFGPDGKMIGDASLQSIQGTDGRKYFGVILDRAFEINSRVHGATVTWDARTPNALSYARSSGGRGSAADLRVIRRTVELPSDKGWGLNELYRVTTSTDAFGGKFSIDYAVRIQRRFRRGTLTSGERVVEGLEVMKTFRVLDGVAGVEMPTSTTKSTMRLMRPK